MEAQTYHVCLLKGTLIIVVKLKPTYRGSSCLEFHLLPSLEQ